MTNSTVDHATYGLMQQFCGERFSDTCSTAIDVGSKASSLVLNFIARTLRMLFSLIRLLICRGELKTTCDTIVTFSVTAGDTMAYLYEHGSVFIRESVIPSLYQAADRTKDFLHINVSPVLIQGWNATKGHMNQAISSALEKSLIAKEQSESLLKDIYEEGHLYVRNTIELTSDRTRNIDFTKLGSLSIEDLHRSIEIGFNGIDREVLLQVLGALVFICILVKLGRLENQKDKRNTNIKMRSLDTRTQSGFLNLDDDLEDEDDFARNPIHRGGSQDLIHEAFPALSRDRDEVDTMDSDIPLPPLQGPAVTSLTFHVHAPPTIEKEIPKVDLVGTLQFVKTGKVRTFVHKGSRRLLIVNFQDMSMEVYIPQPSDTMTNQPVGQKAKKKPKHKNKISDKQSGIHLMSTRNLMALEDDDSDEEDEEDDEKAWDKNNFKSRPSLIISLSDFISVSAATPSQSSVLEVSYKVAASKVKTTKAYPGSNSSAMARAISSQESSNNDDETLAESSACADEIHSVIESSNDHGNMESSKKTRTVERCREFAFLSPHDAAKFQHIVMSLRTSGVAISQLYEMLEELHVNSEAYYPEILPSVRCTKRLKDTDDVKSLEAVRFRPAGVALDDAWRCMHEIPCLREGLLQYHQHAYREFSSKHDDMIVTAASDSSHEEAGGEKTNYRQKMAEFYGTKRSVIGIVDFIFLFVNLPPSTAVPHSTPSGASDIALKDDLGSDVKSGIHVHHQRLKGSLLLQQLVDRASVYVVAYYKANLIVQDGWYLLPRKSTSNETENRDRSEDTAQIKVNLRRLAFDDDRDNWAYDAEHRNEYYQATVGKDVRSMMNGDSSGYQGFSSVGMHVFRLPKPTKKSPRDTSLGDEWLNPMIDPVQYLPSLQNVVQKHKSQQFFIVFYCNKASSTAVCHLYVRSLPVDVDTKFDKSLRNFVSIPPSERDQMLQVSFQFAFDQGWSSIKRIVIRAILGILFRWFFGKSTSFFKKGVRERLSCPPVPARHFARIRHFPLHQHSKNYICITIDDSGSWKNWLVQRFVTKGHKGLTYDYSLSIKDNQCNRVLATSRIVHLDPQSAAMPSDFREERDEVTESLNLALNMSELTPSRRHRRNPLTNENGSSSNDELYSSEIDTVFDILDGVEVSRKYLSSEGEILTQNELVRLHLSRTDIERYLIACACDIEAASVRLIESCAWRGQIFPIDLRQCRIELRSGQLFQQGHDRQKSPIFYYRHWLPGPWTSDINASILAVLYRLETFFQKMSVLKPGIKVTLIVLMDKGDKDQNSTLKTASSDPMMNPNQDYKEHSSMQMFTRLINIVQKHYPERLKAALIVSGTGKWSKSKIREYIVGQGIATPRVILLNNLVELKEYVKDNQLVTFAGGKAPVTPDAFSIL